ncbi:MAG TPA: MarR family transcriptional regulator [Syntrophomonadaceae bacterium]|jgi:biotin operon repressor|nr:MarR family transcriptional regulator [Syntrophomonadaceae bacterium]
MDNESKVLSVFKKESRPLSAKEIADLTGIDKKEVDKIIKKLKASDQLESPKRCYYQTK